MALKNKKNLKSIVFQDAVVQKIEEYMAMYNVTFNKAVNEIIALSTIEPKDVAVNKKLDIILDKLKGNMYVINKID